MWHLVYFILSLLLPQFLQIVKHFVCPRKQKKKSVRFNDQMPQKYKALTESQEQKESIQMGVDIKARQSSYLVEI